MNAPGHLYVSKQTDVEIGKRETRKKVVFQIVKRHCVKILMKAQFRFVV